MDAEAIRAVFAPVGRVDVKRMFGGHGVYADGRMFALEAYGELWLKADAQSSPAFKAAGSEPFVYGKDGKSTVMSYWRMPAPAYDDETELRRWADVAMAAAARAAAGKQKSRARVKSG